MALLLPWYMFLFVGAFDWGYYAHALISTENAARVAGVYASGSPTTAVDAAGVCTFALEELRVVPNIGPSGVTCSGSTPVRVTASLLNATSTPASADGMSSAKVSVQYTTLQLIPIPMLLTNQATFYRTVEMRLRTTS